MRRVRCAYCHDTEGKLERCRGCGALLHEDCVPCPTLGCRRSSPVFRLVQRRDPPHRPPRQPLVDESRVGEFVGVLFACMILLVLLLWVVT